MRIGSCNNYLTFKYNSILKRYWKKGQLPTVVKGFYGEKLTNVTLEHLVPHSQGGKTTLANLVLTTAQRNNLRGNSPLEWFIDKKTVDEYLSQFLDVKLPKFDGNQYVASVKETLKNMRVYEFKL